jgi:hypothetical protein
LQYRERPTGLAYKLRHADTRATMQRYIIGYKANQLKHLPLFQAKSPILFQVKYNG